ncbi:hypothetical protein DL766_002674 [Monosporascus sp. MC13-8B]|uniref:Methyltransferase domain-containing protein n=1 Tax=Monosporascus cannonballus TaxID=155416 RepID=A0ABY0GZW7_9PEZI|nr:hypothetical protein DL762_007472 [Monosporascus cannonballus]RYO83823.1 hypothetical protein DL763_007702 [Monosporascus cannonballus]RYP35110.1 hypothetical protein DL766_002674 [Monosporascus sp. MC13-8B]
MPADFEKQSYWHERFTTETSFEWLMPSETFTSILEPYLARLGKTARILHLGSGTSDLQNQLRGRGFQDITNADYEPLALERGRALEKQAFGGVVTKYVVADVTRLGCEDLPGKFDLVVDKSTVDAVSCGGESALLQMALGIRERLVDGGFWVSLSYSSLRFEIERLPFQVEVAAKVPTPKNNPNEPGVFHWCYLLRPM